MKIKYLISIVLAVIFVPTILFAQVSGSYWYPTAGILNTTAPYPLKITGIGTSTFTGPIKASCFTTDGNTCIGSNGTVGAGTMGQNAYYSSTNTVTGTSTLFILPNGHTGVGTTTPLQVLSVIDPTVAASIPLHIENALNSGGQYVGLSMGRSIEPTMSEILTYAELNGTRALHFFVERSGALTDTMDVVSNGTVGIASTTPSSALSIAMASTTSSLTIGVAGSSSPALFVDSANNNGYVGIRTSTPVAPLEVIDTGIQSASSGIELARAGVPTQFIGISEDASVAHWIAGAGSKPFFFTNQDTSAASGFEFDVNNSTSPGAGTRAFNIITNGNVGIATTTPNFLLSVVGAIGFGTGGINSPNINATGAAPNQNLVFTAGGLGENIFNSTPAGSLSDSNVFKNNLVGNTQNVASFLAPNATTGVVGQGPYFCVGVSETTGNVACPEFAYVGSGSSLNALGFSIYGSASVMNIFSTGVDFGSYTSAPPAGGIIVSGKSGFGTTSPYATLSISSGSGTSNTDVFAVATSTGNAVFGVDNDGHTWTSGPAPAISSCGTGTGTVVGDDQTGVITTATAATACTMTFSKAYRNSPVCTVTDNSLVGFADISSASVSAVTFGISSALTGGNLYYRCNYHQ